MKYLVVITIFFVLLLPSVVFGACDTNNFTVVYINGIFTSKRSDAENDTRRLQKEFGQRFTLTNIHFVTGYNPSHLAGVADLIQVASQFIDAPLSDYDLKNILLQIYPQVTTRKILLVGHSQGTFYANEMYGYLTNNGGSKDSIGVYNVATPAYEVAGGGAYLTSQNDTVINAVREAAKRVGARQPLPANIVIPPTASDSLGHSFQNVYLANAAGRIISEMEGSLGKLTAGDFSDTTDTGCFTPPPKDFSYRAQQAVFAVADPMANGAADIVTISQRIDDTLAAFLESGVRIAAGGIKDAATLLVALGQGVLPSQPAVLSSSSSQVTSAPPPQISENVNNDGTETQSLAEAVADNAGGAPDAVFAEDAVPSLVPDTVTTNGGLSSDGGSSGGAFSGGFPFDSISAPGAGAAPADNSAAVQQNQTALPSVLSPASEASSTESATSTPQSAPPPPPPDTTPPDIAFSVEECATASISSGGCLLVNPAINLFWSSVASDFDHFEITCEVNGSSCAGFSFAPTSATSTEFTLTEGNKAYTFRAKAIDAVGNISSEAAQTVAFSAMPVVINEVAWMGTGSSAVTSKDEWFELYNTTDYSVNLSDWTVAFYKPGTTTPAHVIALAGAIPAGSFYLVERTDDTAVADVAADLASSFGSDGLLNSGMIIKLAHGETTIDRTPELCGGAWCGGSSTTYQTMERIEPSVAGETAANWGTALGEFIVNGTNADGVFIKGTPKKRNSINYLISQTRTLPQNKTLAKARSPYLIPRGGLTIPAGVTLSVEPGVVVKFVSPNEPSLVINGTIQSNGTADDPAVFTAFADDAYGGDMNGDGLCDPGNASSTAACPLPGSWMQILLTPSSAGSEFHNTLIRYGGRWFTNMTLRGMVDVDTTAAVFDAVTFEYAQKHGLQLNVSDSRIQNSTFRSNNTDSDAAGLYAIGGSPVISQNTFQKNSIGLQMSGSSATVNGNVFTDNNSYAIYSQGHIGAFRENSGSGNGKNGILLSGELAAAGATTTLEANPIPYIAGGTLPRGAGLIVNSGVTFAGDRDMWLTVNGAMVLGGANKDDILFTSLNNSAAGEWGGIAVNAGGSVSGGGFTLRYGGGSPSACFSSCAGLKINGGTVELTDGRIEKNFTAGMRIFNNASTTLSNFEFNDNAAVTYGAQVFGGTGLVLSGGGVVLNNVSFTGNALGISSVGSTVAANGVTFADNTVNTSPADLIP